MHNWTEQATELLPPVLQNFVRLVGLAATMVLVEHFGGLRVYIPANPDQHHPLAQLIGLDKLTLLSQEYGGIQHFQLPKATRSLKALRNARIMAEYGRKSARTLAAEHRLTEGQIIRIAANAKGLNDRQTDLF